jgi:hypothetical protein
MIEKLLQFFVGEINAKLFEPVELHSANEWGKKQANTVSMHKV